MTPSQTLKILLPTTNEINKRPAGCQKPQPIIFTPYAALAENILYTLYAV